MNVDDPHPTHTTHKTSLIKEEAVHCCTICLKMKGVVVSHVVTGVRHGASHCPHR